MFPVDVASIGRLNVAVSSSSTSELWHLRLGHLNYKSLNTMAHRGMVFGLPKLRAKQQCEDCVVSKRSRTSFPNGRGSRKTNSVLQLVHIDLCGPMSEQSLGGNKYFFLLVDDYSRFCWVYLIKNKSEAFQNFLNFHTLVERETGRKLKIVGRDRGGEFSSLEFQKYCNGIGIKREYTAPYSPQQNGVVERKNRTVIEMSRSLLKSGKLPLNFWGEAVSTAIYLINSSPTKYLHGKTPYEAWHGVKPTISHLRVFGCLSFALITSHKLKKLEEKSVKCVFIGYSSQSKAYRLYDPLTCRVIVSRDVVFHESSRWN